MIVIKSVSEDMHSWCNCNFVWPSKIGSVVTAPDWNSEPKRGHGLHGLRPGDNDPGVWMYRGNYLALEVNENEIVPLDGNCKFPKCVVSYVTDNRLSLHQWLNLNKHFGPWFYGCTIVENEQTAFTGSYGQSISGSGGKSASGKHGTSVSGDKGISLSKMCGNSISGKEGISVSGPYGTSTSGMCGLAAAGNRGTICIAYCKTSSSKRASRILTGYVGENGIKPDTLYAVVDEKFVEVDFSKNTHIIETGTYLLETGSVIDISYILSTSQLMKDFEKC